MPRHSAGQSTGVLQVLAHRQVCTGCPGTGAASPEPVDSTSLLQSRCMGCSFFPACIRVKAWADAGCAQLFVEYHPAEVDSFIQIADSIEDAFPGLQVEGVERRDLQQSSIVLRGESGEVLRVQAGKVPPSAALVEALEKVGYQAD